MKSEKSSLKNLNIPEGLKGKVVQLSSFSYVPSQFQVIFFTISKISLEFIILSLSLFYSFDLALNKTTLFAVIPIS